MNATLKKGLGCKLCVNRLVSFQNTFNILLPAQSGYFIGKAFVLKHNLKIFLRVFIIVKRMNE